MGATKKERDLIRLFGAFVEYCCTDTMIDQEDIEADQSKVWYSSKPIWQYSYIDFRNYVKECNNIVPLIDIRYDEDGLADSNGKDGYEIIMDLNNIKVSFFEYKNGSKKLKNELIFKSLNEMSDWLRDQYDHDMCYTYIKD